MNPSTTLASPAPARSLVLPALLACYLVWGSTYLAIRFALESFPPFFQMGPRTSFMGSPVAIACLAGATLAWSLGSVLSTTRWPLAPGAAGFASEMLCGGGALLLVSLVLGEQPQWPPQPLAAAAWLYLVVAGSLVAFSAYLYLLAHASPALATSYAFVNPVIALLLGVLLAGEAVSAAEWGACAVILAGVVLILKGKDAGASR